jgi:competence protein ComEA
MGDMGEMLLDRRRVLVAAVALVVVLALAGRMLLRPHPAAVPPPVRVAASSASASKPARLFVHVVGAVRRPGLYRVPDGARVADAVTRAGGPTPKAQLELVNLAARLADGEQVVVPRRGATGVPAAGGAGGTAPLGPVHLNSATLEQLDALPGVGPVTAQKILDYRQQHGGFGSVDELDAVPGIGPARLANLRALVAP